MAGRVANPRLTGYGIIQPGAHPERGAPAPKRKPVSVTDVTQTTQVPLRGGLGTIKAEIARKNAINRGARILKRKMGY